MKSALCVLGLLGGSAAHADAPACKPTVQLAGDAPAVDGIARALAARGIAVVPAGGELPVACPIVRARVAADPGGALVLTIDGDAGPIERRATDSTTAATVIESWARADLGGPLLDARPIAVAEATPEPARAPAPSPPRDEGVAVARPAEVRGIQLAVAAEAAVGSDRTTWGGVSLGACVGLGPVCAAVKVHIDGVVTAPADFGNFERTNKEVLLGLDVPLVVGGTRVVPGFSAGLGSMHTHVDDQRPGGETGGLRADAHITLEIPLGPRWALDVALSGDLTQATSLETNTNMPLPPEPRGIVRLGFGVGYGGL